MEDKKDKDLRMYLDLMNNYSIECPNCDFIGSTVESMIEHFKKEHKQIVKGYRDNFIKTNEKH